ncbi:CRP-like cAMP-binding protein [Neolewinella xylanilytica]|uniref:CRP-like cAMP-binding protein n=1 Tax=Neolewinella xylanilytica TaxID=1514080 RepID=A0A2S6I1C7_9BACT|nr:Crp/Fnr family transcriptional regulator [Neolewinella xylanilytica]PPK84756.1 CRP-like cAMP-binding protein [Neolewinella xylanilytica]
MEQLFANLKLYCTVSEEDYRHIRTYFTERHLDKKEIVYEADRPNLHHYFVVSGCLQMYFITQRGQEQTLQFAIPDWWLTDYRAWHHGRSSEFSIQAVRESVVLEISRDRQAELLHRYPQLETYFRKIYETAYGTAQRRIKFMFDYSKEEIYFSFRDAHPEIANSVPQYLLAGYLGLTPEYLSKLRHQRNK